MEQLGCLPVLLASFSILSWPVTLADSQVTSVVPPPSELRLFVWPPHSIFTQREKISLICSLPKGQRATGFHFHEKKAEGRWALYTQQAENTLELFTTSLGTKQAVACSYWGVKSAGEPFLSPLSNEVVISITDPQATPAVRLPPAPRLSMTTSGTIQGAWNWLICHVPEGQKETGFLFHEKKAEGGWTLYTHQAENTLAFSGTHLETRLTFACSYWEENSAGALVQSSLSNEVVISITDSQTPSVGPLPPAPRLSLTPSGSTFIRGERVCLICHLPEGRRATDFLFYEMNADGGWTSYKQQKKNTLEFSTEHLMPVKSFACSYNEEPQKQSAQSNTVEFSVTEFPLATLSLVPWKPIYIQGEPVTLECSAPQSLDVAGYKFYKKRQGQGFKKLPSKGTRQYELLRVAQNTAGQYSCLYWMLLSGQEIQSPRSSPVSVAMTDRPRPPLVSMFPQQRVYERGESVNLTCSPPPGNHRFSRVQFFKDGGQLHLITPSPSSVIFTHSLRLLPQDGGQYSCVYHVMKSGREIPSQESNPIRISVMAGYPFTTWPTFSNAAQAPLGTAVTKGATDTSTRPTSEASLPSSSQPAAINTTKTYPERHIEPPGSTTASSPLSSLHHSAASSPPPQEATKSSTSCNATNSPYSRLQTSPSSKPTQGSSSLFLWLASGCGAGGGLLLLAFLVAVCRRKYKENRQTSTRNHWRSLNFQTSVKRRRCNEDPIGVFINLQEGSQNGQLQPMSRDWGILPKTKSPAPKRENPYQEKKTNEDTDSGADVRFPDIDPTYTLLGFSCSTFFQERNDGSTERTHIRGEPFI